MAGEVLLIHDDVVAIAVIRRLLAGRGHPMILATSVADALIAFGHHAPNLVVLAPSVEGGRGALALRELSSHPNARATRVLLLGDSVEGSNAPVAALPLDGTAFLQTVSRLIDAAEKLRAHPPGVEAASAAPAADWWHPTAPAREKRPNPPTPSKAELRAGATNAPAARAPVASAPAANAPVARVPVASAPTASASAASAPTAPPLPPQPPAVAQHALRLAAAADAPRIGNVPSTGKAAQEPLARMMADLCASRSSCRLELKAAEAHRVLWLRDGSLHCATSSVYQESLLGRARADGLIDRQQEAELRAMRGASPSELLGALRSRGYLREIEVVPLVQRWTEQIAIEALGEAESSFRVSPPQLPKNALLAASPVPLLQLLPRALYRAATESSLLEALGGLNALASPRLHAVEVELLGLSPKQLALLAAVDGTSSMGELLLAAGLPQKLALQALHLGKVLGVLDVHAAAEPSPPPEAPELDLRRLHAKFEEVQEGDYFSVLGLPRSAGADEVRRAFQSLAEEFNPLKFAGHPDPSVQRQVQVVRDLLAEAARALQDDRVRTGYSKSLVD